MSGPALMNADDGESRSAAQPLRTLAAVPGNACSPTNLRTTDEQPSGEATATKPPEDQPSGDASVDRWRQVSGGVAEQDAFSLDGNATAAIAAAVAPENQPLTTAEGDIVNPIGINRPRGRTTGTGNGRTATTCKCQADGCEDNLDNAENYHRRHKVCKKHFKDLEVLVDGQRQRFCQQCSRFHLLSYYEGEKRSCWIRLWKRSKRRRKGAAAGAIHMPPHGMVPQQLPGHAPGSQLLVMQMPGHPQKMLLPSGSIAEQQQSLQLWEQQQLELQQLQQQGASLEHQREWQRQMLHRQWSQSPTSWPALQQGSAGSSPSLISSASPMHPYFFASGTAGAPGAAGATSPAVLKGMTIEGYPEGAAGQWEVARAAASGYSPQPGAAPHQLAELAMQLAKPMPLPYQSGPLGVHPAPGHRFMMTPSHLPYNQRMIGEGGTTETPPVHAGQAGWPMYIPRGRDPAHLTVLNYNLPPFYRGDGMYIPAHLPEDGSLPAGMAPYPPGATPPAGDKAAAAVAATGAAATPAAAAGTGATTTKPSTPGGTRPAEEVAAAAGLPVVTANGEMERPQSTSPGPLGAAGAAANGIAGAAAATAATSSGANSNSANGVPRTGVDPFRAPGGTNGLWPRGADGQPLPGAGNLQSPPQQAAQGQPAAAAAAPVAPKLATPIKGEGGEGPLGSTELRDATAVN